MARQLDRYAGLVGSRRGKAPEVTTFYGRPMKVLSPSNLMQMPCPQTLTGMWRDEILPWREREDKRVQFCELRLKT